MERQTGRLDLPHVFDGGDVEFSVEGLHTNSLAHLVEKERGIATQHGGLGAPEAK